MFVWMLRRMLMMFGGGTAAPSPTPCANFITVDPRANFITVDPQRCAIVYRC